MDGFEKIVEITPAYDRRHADPKQNYGVHGVEMRFLLKKAGVGAVQFLLSTGWQLPHITEETDRRTLGKVQRGEPIAVDLHCFYQPMAVDRGYHSLTPRYPGQTARENCPYLNGATCYYDGSGLNAQVVFDAMLSEGDQGLWRELEYYFTQVFETPLEERTVEGAEFGVVIKALTDGIS